MATLTLSGGSPERGPDSGLARASVLISVLSDEVTTGTHTNSSQVTFSNGVVTIVANGTFSNFDSFGYPGAGTVTSYSVTSDIDTPGFLATVTVTGISLPVPTLLVLVATENVEGLETAIIGGADTLNGSAFPDTLWGWRGNDIINAGDGNDSIRVWPNEGHDNIDGGAGVDFLEFTLSDLFSPGPTVNITFDLSAMASAAGYAVADGSFVRNVELFNLAGGQGADTFLVNAFSPANVFEFKTPALDGGAGGDILRADFSWSSARVDLFGSDSQQQGSFAGYKIYRIEQYDVTSGSGDDTLAGAGGADILRSGLGNDQLFGEAGDDTLDGGAGADHMEGGAGNDTFYVDNAGDTTAFLLDDGIDTVNATVSYTLTDAIENLNLLGAALNGTGSFVANVITGNALDNVLRGMYGNDTLIGGDGNDILDGGDRIDRMDGGAGDDTIFADSLDDLANVVGGSGVDVFVFTSSPMPTTFDLVAHGFESAELRLTDTGGNAWATQTTFYDTAWQVDRLVTVNDNGSHAELDYDQASAFSWTTNYNQYDTAGGLDINVTVYDTGVTAAFDYDQANEFNWVSNWNQYNAASALDINVTVYDTGVTASNDFDEANAFNWTTNFSQYDVGGAIDFTVTVFDSGVTSAFDYDQIDAFDWASNWNQYSPGGALDINVTVYDNGTSAVNEYDQDNAFDWTTNWALYDAAGHIDQNVVEYDNGNTAVIDYDQANQFAWASIWQLYDSNDVLIGYQGVNDDGSIFGH